MKFSSVAVALALFLAEVSDARPSRLQQRVAARGARASRPLEAAVDTVPTDNAHVEYSSNWSGVVLTSPPSNQTFTTVTGTFVVPTPSGTGAASAWVGIDGDTAQNSILQAGVDFTVSSGGSVSFDAWYEWYPDYAVDFSNFAISAGNTITITVHSTSTTAGTVVLKNVSTGKSVTQSVSAPSSSSALAGQNAEWIVEDFEENGSLVTLTNFGTVVFTSSSASTSSQSVGVSNGTVMDIKQSSTILTSVSIDSDSQITVTHL